MSSTKEKPPTKQEAPPRPEVPPGQGGPVRNPNSNDVLSGRGGRINSHSGNVRFREMVESLKREYLDPRTKKLEKARIAARLVASIRHSEPPGRFLKEDPHTGLWIEIGDERAWKKAGQALRESAPEIRAEQQAQLQAAVAAAGGAAAVTAGIVGGGGGGASSSSVGVGGSSGPIKTPMSPVDEFCEDVGSGGEGGRSSRHHHHGGYDGIPGRRKNGGGGGGMSMASSVASGQYGSSSRSMSGGASRSSRQASDPPGPRHRPNPPDREGLARSRQQPYQNTYEHEMYNDPRMMNNANMNPSSYGNYDDRDLHRMRHAQQQQQHYGSDYNPRQYSKHQLQERYRDVYDDYSHVAEQQIQQRMEQLTQEQYQYRQKQQQLQQQQQQSSNSRSYQPHEIAAALQNDDLLPVHAGFVIPSIRGDPQPPSQQEYEQQQMKKNYEQFQQQRRMQQQIQMQERQQAQMQQQQQQGDGNGGRGGNQYYEEDRFDDMIPHHSEAFDRFNPISSGESVASFDVQSMDMSSIGNFSFNQSTNTFGGQSSRGDHNISMMSGLISTGSQMSRGSMAQRTAKSKQNRKSALERKLEKVNMEHRRQQAEEMDKRKMLTGSTSGGGTSPNRELYQEQGTFQVPTREEGGGGRKNSNNPHDYSFKSKMHDQSLNSFGFEAIEEDAMTEASYKLSNLGLSEMSMGTMTFNSDVLSIKSRADGGLKSSGGSDSKSQEDAAASSDGGGGGKKRSGSETSGNTDSKNPVTASSVFDQSISSNGNSSKGGAPSFDLDNFNESFRSMDMEDRAGGGGAPLPDPDGVGARGSGTNNAMDLPQRRQKPMSSSARSSSRQQDPSGGRLPTVARGVGNGTTATVPAAGAPEARRESESNNPGLDDFGVSFNSIASNASSWLNQYDAMEEIGSDKNPWDDEESRGSSMSEISAPRMVSVDAGRDI